MNADPREDEREREKRKKKYKNSKAAQRSAKSILLWIYIVSWIRNGMAAFHC